MLDSFLRYNEYDFVIPHMKGCDITVKAVLRHMLQ